MHDSLSLYMSFFLALSGAFILLSTAYISKDITDKGKVTETIGMLMCAKVLFQFSFVGVTTVFNLPFDLWKSKTETISIFSYETLYHSEDTIENPVFKIPGYYFPYISSISALHLAQTPSGIVYSEDEENFIMIESFENLNNYEGSELYISSFTSPEIAYFYGYYPNEGEPHKTEIYKIPFYYLREYITNFGLPFIIFHVLLVVIIFYFRRHERKKGSGFSY